MLETFLKSTVIQNDLWVEWGNKRVLDNNVCGKGLTMDGFFIEGYLPVRTYTSFLLVWSVPYLKGIDVSTRILQKASRDLRIYLMPVFSI